MASNEKCILCVKLRLSLVPLPQIALTLSPNNAGAKYLRDLKNNNI
jgi:hypothetical protein